MKDVDELGVSSSPPSTWPKEVAGKYEMGKLVGCGAFAKVYHARDVATGQSVAIKSISKRHVVSSNLAAMVKREIVIMRRLRHDNIIRLHEVIATRTKIYFVMEFAKGGELFEKVSRGRFSEDLSRRYFRQLVSAVRYCHSRGVYHRDLKLENLLLDENWELKVTDFGLSALVADDPAARQDGGGGLLLHTLCGTPAYVAPEILAKKGYDGATVDVWSCGIILYVLNASYLPFNDRNLAAMYRKIYRGDFRCPKWTSPELKRFLKRILDPNPSTRITVAEILNDPWFSKDGYSHDAPLDSQLPAEREFQFKGHFSSEPEPGPEPRFLNAFDLISFSPGSDLSGLFNHTHAEAFISDESPEGIVEKMQSLGKEESLGVVVGQKGGTSVRLHGLNGLFTAMVEISRLTEELVVVAVRTNGDGDVWREKLKPRLSGLLVVS